MLSEIRRIIAEASERDGWVMEPDAKKVLNLANIRTPRFHLAKTAEDASEFAAEIGFPVVVKIVSPAIVHKSDVKGVAVGVQNKSALTDEFLRLSELDGFVGVLVEEMVSGLELIAGAKIDYQFGPVILLGIGGTGVEIYQDATIRMAPLSEKDVELMVKKLKAHKLLEGYRGSSAVDMKALSRMLVSFSELAFALSEEIESIDLNPVFCSEKHCIVGDARILLASRQ